MTVGAVAREHEVPRQRTQAAAFGAIRARSWTARARILLAVACLVLVPACGGDPARVARSFPDVEAAMQAMTLEQRVGQLFVLFAHARVEDEERAALLDDIRAVAPGGLIVSLGTAEQAAELITDAQAAATESGAGIPLLVAGDFERGLAFRLRGTTDLGPAMLLGATRSESLADRAGRVAAREGRALGFHWHFAPVLDVNSNPANPIINVRSFGEDPALVAKLGAAYIRGLQDEVTTIACAKHFPGHGDVATDSHLSLATVPGDRERLERVELPPFRAAIAEGVGSIMTGHLSVPGLGEVPELPATLSSRILTGLLRVEYGFDGLIVTDALDMGGVSGARPPEEVAVEALRAGADVLLMPPGPIAARDAVVTAVRDGRIPAERLDEAVRRILRAKMQVHALGPDATIGPRQDWRDHVPDETDGFVAEQIANFGTVLVSDPGNHVPLDPTDAPLVVQVFDEGRRARPEESNIGFPERLSGYLGAERLTTKELGRTWPITTSDVDSAIQAIRSSPTVVLALYTEVRSGTEQLGLPEEVTPLFTAVAEHPGAIVVSFGSPYVLGAFADSGASTVCAFAESYRTEIAVARALVGNMRIRGLMPIGIPGLCNVGDGLQRDVVSGRERGDRTTGTGR